MYNFFSNIPIQEKFEANFNEMWCKTTPHELFDLFNSFSENDSS